MDEPSPEAERRLTFVLLYGPVVQFARQQGAAEPSVFYTDNNGWLEQRRQFSPRRTFPDGTSTLVAPSTHDCLPPN